MFEKRKAIQKAISLTQEGRLDKAIAEYETIVGADPSDSSLYNTLGDLYVQTGSTPNALAYYLKLVDALRAEGRLTRAIAVYKKIIKLDPNNHAAMVACADLYAQEGLRAEAKHLYVVAAEGALKRGVDKQAIDATERLLRLEPLDTSAAVNLASLLARQGRRSEAADLLGRLVQELRAHSRLDDAELLHQRMVEIAPEASTALKAEGKLSEGTPVSLGIVDFYMKQGMEAEARALLRRLAAVEPERPEVSQRLLSLESKAQVENDPVIPEIEIVQSDRAQPSVGSASLGDFLAELERHGKIDGDEAGTFQSGPQIRQESMDSTARLTAESLSSEPVAGRAASSRDQDLADSIIPDWTDRSGETYETHYQLGMAYREMGLLDDAIDEFRRSAVDERLAVHACNMVGLCLLVKGETEAAIHELRQALSIAGRPAEEFRSVKYNLATAYQSTGDHSTALTILSDLQDEDPSFRDVRSRVIELQGRPGKVAENAGASEGNVDAKRWTRSE